MLVIQMLHCYCYSLSLGGSITSGRQMEGQAQVFLH